MSFSQIQRVRKLYKIILRLHRSLPEEIQAIGTNYAREEFKRHMKCNEYEAQVFMKEWTNYALMLGEQLGLKGTPITPKNLGKALSETDLEDLRDEQVFQLYELMEAVKAPVESSESNNKR